MNIKKRTIFILLFLLVFCTVNATDYYVDADFGSNASGDGSSGNPWQTITYALTQISGSGHVIHVAEGYYDSSIGESFPIYVKNGVSLDGAGDSLTVIDAGYSERVLNCIGITDASTVIKGFTITGGYYSDNFTTGAGIYISAGSTLTIKQNLIMDNYLGTWGKGGGIYITNSSPRILYNTLYYNGSDYWGEGDAIYIYNSSPYIKGNTIIYNISNESDNTIYISGSSSAPKFLNNIIAMNSAGIYCLGGIPTFINNTISDNSGTGIYISGCQPDSIINNIISFNSGYGIQESGTSSDPGKVWYNQFFANSSGLYYDEGSTAYYTADALNSGVVECILNTDKDPLFIDRAGTDYRVRLYSPSIDAGDPDSPYGNEPEPNGNRINLGAYGNTSLATTSEESPALPADLYVDAVLGSNDTGDGSSASPWQTITYAFTQIFSAGHTIHVAVGTYNTELGESFPIYMKNGVSLSGADMSTTIVDAEATSGVISCIGITDASTFIEGFTITGGYLSEYYSHGAGILISAGSVLTIRNNIITDNSLYLLSQGAGIYISNSAPFILDNIISDNSVYSQGEGNAMVISNSSPVISGNSIINNIGSYSDYCIYIYGELSAPEISRNLIAGNSSDAIYVSSGSSSIINNTISDNEGNGINITSGTPASIVNNIISYNSLYGIYESSSSYDPLKVEYNLFYANSSGVYHDEGSTDYYTSSTLNSAVAECANNLDGDPVFTDRTNDNYHIELGSSAINTGDPSSPLDPDGSCADIGAYFFIMPPPDAPIATGATNIGQTDFTANWNSAATASGYYLDIAANSDFTAFVENFENRDVLNLTSYSVTGLSANTEYYYRVRAYNEGGIGSNSNVISLNTTVDPPAPPATAPVVYAGTDITQTSFLSDWNPVDGATSYRIDVAVEIDPVNYVSGYYNLEVLNATECMVTGLTANTDYYYWVRACNSGGASVNSDTVVVKTLINPPPAPYITETNNITQTSFTGNWFSSATATGYYLDVATDDAFTSFVSGYENLDISDVTSYSVTGLTSNTTYYYRVKAYNTGGDSDYSDFSGVTTLPDPPEPPLFNDPTNILQTSFTVNWNSSATATGYYLDVATDDAFTSFVSGYENLDVSDVTSYDVTGLTDETIHYYRLRAYNSGGASTDSETWSMTTLMYPPSAASVAYEATDTTQTSFTANWDMEIATTVTGYYLDVAIDDAFTSFVSGYEYLDILNVTSYSITGLNANTTYYYRVYAYNDGGAGDVSNTISVVTLQVPVPDAPVANEASYVGQTDFIASWNSSATATGYYLDVATDNTFTSFVTDYDNRDVGDLVSYSITGLAVNTTYYYRVRAYNDGGASDNSDIITVTTLENPPDPPGSPLVDPATDITQTSFTANWQTSTDATGYLLDIASDDAFINILYEDIDLSNTTSYNITDLTSNTIYYYRLRAYNSGGTSNYSGTVSVTTLPAPPLAPVANDATIIVQSSFMANWESSATATGYNLDVATDDTFTSFVAGYENLDVSGSLSCSVNGLTLNTTYYYRVRAYNDGGESGSSNSITVTTLLNMPDIPDAPVATEAESISQTGFTAVWNSVTNAEGYYLDVAYDNTFSSYLPGYYSLNAGNTTTQDITGLQSNTDYYYRVSGYNVSGTGNNSNVIQVSTLPDPPAAPTGLSASSCSNEVYLQWDESTESDFVQYNVYWGTTTAPTTLYDSYTDVSWNAITITISDLNNGQTYYFRVTTVISQGVESDFSSTTSVEVKTGVIPQIKAKWGNVLICYNLDNSLTSFQWFIGTTLIAGATKQYYVTNKESGVYFVITADQDGCINHSNAIYIAGSKSLSVYPNPAKSNFTLYLSSEAHGKTVVSLYNSTGMKTLEYTTEKTGTKLNCEIPVGNLKDGIYMVEVIVNNEEINYTRLMIIE